MVGPAACDGDGDGGSSSGSAKATGEAGCEEASDCKKDVCVALIDNPNPPVYCSETCTSGSCPSSMYCDTSTFSLLNLSFCRFGSTSSEGSVNVPASEPPRLPCKADADCESGQVCATVDGKNSCAIPCTVESDCTPPPLPGGVEMDLATCGQDDNAKKVCVPDLACWQPDPVSTGCVKVPGIPGF
ncbi:MAG: hypothetical protein R3F39_09240 [Myxococcota bacterium]